MFVKSARTSALAAALLLWLGMMLSPVLKAGEVWARVQHPTLDFLFLGATQAGTFFNRFYVEPVSVWYPESGDGHEPHRIVELRRLAEESFVEALSAAGMQQVEGPGTGVLVVHAELIDMKSTPPTPAALDWARGFRFRVEPGRLTLVAELRAGDSDEVIIRLADLEETERGTWDSGVADALSSWGRVIASTVISASGQRVARTDHSSLGGAESGTAGMDLR